MFFLNKSTLSSLSSIPNKVNVVKNIIPKNNFVLNKVKISRKPVIFDFMICVTRKIETTKIMKVSKVKNPTIEDIIKYQKEIAADTVTALKLLEETFISNRINKRNKTGL